MKLASQSTERHRMTVEDVVARLFHGEEPFRLFVEAVKDYAIFLLDTHGNVVSWNVGAQRIKGYSASEVIGTHFSRFYTEEDKARGLPAHLLRDAQAESRVENEGWRVRKDGTRFWADVVITPLYDSSGVLRGYGKVTRDLTVKHNLEVLQQSENRLYEFLAMLSHELRNPLAPMVNALALLRSGREVESDRLLGIIDRQVSHMSRIVDDLLDVGRLTSGKMALKTDIVELNRLVLQAAESCQSLVDSREHAIELRSSGGPLYVEADSTRIVQVVVNLITNAAKFTRCGGRITVAVERKGDHAIVRVVDNGVGIPAASLASIFGLFVQGEQSLDRAAGGLGIGLTLVKRLTEMHGGTVSVSSGGADRGSEFVVRLPAATQQAAAIESNKQAAAIIAARRFRVLVVDDNKDFAMTLEILLEMAGHEVRAVNDGIAAYDVAMDFRPEIVLLDIGLPGMTGYELAGRLRRLPELAGSTLIALTGYGQTEDRQRVAEAGFDGHLVKPVEPTELLSLIDRLRPRTNAQTTAGALGVRSEQNDRDPSGAQPSASRFIPPGAS
jgi:PAS domain S-box-containing protein